MAKTKRKPEATRKESRTGRISQVIGAVVDVQFPAGQQPELFEALEVKVGDRNVILEVASDVGDNVVRCIAMDTTDGIHRGDAVNAPGAPTSRRAGAKPRGPLFTLVAQAIDNEPTPEGGIRWPIH